MQSTAVLRRIAERSVEAPCLVKGLDPLCWVWTGACSNGYGYTSVKGQSRSVHRLVYVLLITDPNDLELDHLCRRRPCWNPAHLDPVTHSVNVKRGRIAAILRAKAARVADCPQGHAYVGENDCRKKDGKRYCRQCYLDRYWNRRKLAGMVSSKDRTHCKNGHPYSDENTRVSPRGHRVCRTCQQDRTIRFRARRAA